MKITFFGAAREVTGSCHHIEANGKKLLIDCGLEQGQDDKDNQKLFFKASEIDYVLVTHAHIDHSGRLPLLVKEGFNGKIFATRKTCELLSIMLRDSAHIQEMDALWQNKKGRRAGEEEAVPLYTVLEAEETLKLLVPQSYGEIVNIAEGISARFTDAGHLLGSSSIEMKLTEGGITKKIVFSGDIGNVDQPIIRDPQYIKEADYVVMEATYGDRNHEHSDDYTLDLANIIDKTLGAGGNVIIPSFAVGRTQELLYFIREMKERNLVKSNPNFQVYVDSPLAAEATKIYSGDLRGYADEETTEVIRSGAKPIGFSGLALSQTTEESKQLNEDPTPKVIISSSGMCEAGRIRHHLKHNLWRPECAIVFVGYQANGTLGRIILDGVKRVKLFGEEIAVKAQVYSFKGLSAHADRDGLIKWVSSFEPKPANVFVTHGENEVCDIFVRSLSEMGFNAVAPNFKMVYDLAQNVCVDIGIPFEQMRPAAKVRAVSHAFKSLLEAGDHLIEVIRKNEGLSNKLLAKFRDQINQLAKKWDR